MTYDPKAAMAWLAAQVGTVEDPPHSNHVPFWPMWQQLTGQHYAGQGDAWCGCLAWLGCHHGGLTLPDNFVSVAAIEDYARAHHIWSDRADGARLGDLVVLFGRGVHVEFVVSREAGGLRCIGGNTGDAVRATWRPDSDVHGVAHLSTLAGATAPASPNPAPAPLPSPRPAPAPAPAKPPAPPKHAGAPQKPAGIVVELPELHEGSHGHVVNAVQHLLGVSPDGVFGPVTATAVRNRQVLAWPHERARWDGVIGNDTWHVLLGLA